MDNLYRNLSGHEPQLQGSTMPNGNSGASQPVGAYTYSRLEPGGKEIRLLQLLPGKRGSQIVISIETAQFTTKSTPDYEALSYTWGDENDKVAIIVCDGPSAWSLEITKNCEEALQYLRRAKRERVFWIDAICINQADDAEKEDQVFHMVQIYRRARRVVAWLGPAGPDTHVAIAWMNTVNQNLGYDEETGHVYLLEHGDNKYISRERKPMINLAQSRALENFQSRSWFGRLWIWQEVKSGEGHTVLVCGGHMLEWRRFKVGKIYLGGNRLACDFKDADRFFSVLRLCKRYPRRTLRLMIDMSQAQCRDARDRIYVAEALTLDDEHRTRPDYSTGWRTVYRRWAEGYAVRSNLLNFLSCSGQSSVDEKFPSWVPLWYSKTAPLALDQHFAHGGSASRCSVPAPGQLLVSGLHITKVQSTIDLAQAEWMLLEEDRMRFLKDVTHKALDGDYSSANVAAFVRTINAERYNEVSDRPLRHSHSWKIAEAALARILSKEPDDWSYSEEQRSYALSAMRRWRGRAFFKSSSGRCGLCPVQTELGDRVVAVLGCTFLIVLRPFGAGRYQVVGPARLDGMMSGEEALGQLPEHVEFTWFRQGLPRWPAYKNMATGEIAFDDPRLPPLPSNWKDVSKEDTPWEKVYEEVETGERRDAWSDPRCDVEALKKRGVKVQNFTLV